jgi:hypothetical protein
VHERAKANEGPRCRAFLAVAPVSRPTAARERMKMALRAVAELVALWGVEVVAELDGIAAVRDVELA